MEKGTNKKFKPGGPFVFPYQHEEPEIIEGEIVCVVCGDSKPVKDFYLLKPGFYRQKCKGCIRLSNQKNK